MSSSDWQAWIIPTIISVIISFVIVGLSRFTRIGDKTISGTIRIDNLSGDLDDVKKNITKGFDKVERAADNNRDDINAHIEKLSEKIGKLSEIVNVHEYRLNRLDHGGMKSAV